MEALSSKLKSINRTDVPIFLDSNTASFLDVAVHAKIRQYLSEGTIEKHLRYARFMELHPMPVDFRNLTPEMFLKSESCVQMVQSYAIAVARIILSAIGRS